MARKTIDNFPDYLQDFDELKSISTAIEAVVIKFRNTATTMLNARWLDSYDTERWEEIVWKFGIAEADNVALAAHRMYPVITMDEVNYYLKIWMLGKKYTVNYDYDSCTFTIRTTATESTMRSLKTRIRNFLPMNMEVVFEHVNEL